LDTDRWNLYSSPNIIRQMKSRRMRWAGHVARTEEERKVYKVLVVGKPKGRRPLGRARHRREDEIRMDRRKIDWGCVEWIQLTQDIGWGCVEWIQMTQDRWRALVNSGSVATVLVGTDAKTSVCRRCRPTAGSQPPSQWGFCLC
jgi:hypothetical protein